MPDLEWMAWTPGTALFVAGVLVFLVAITALAVLRPSVPRKGFLPIETARGDRIYVGLLGPALVMILFVAATDLPLPLGLAAAACWVGPVLRWG
jgi:predicted small integral membrane protein